MNLTSIWTKSTQPMLIQYRHKTLSLKVPNVEFDFDVYVDSVQFRPHTSKTWCPISLVVFGSI